MLAVAFFALPAAAQCGTGVDALKQTFKPDSLTFGEFPNNMNFDSVDVGQQQALSGMGGFAANDFIVDKDQIAGRRYENVTKVGGTTLDGEMDQSIESDLFDSSVLNIENIQSDGQSAFAFGRSTATNRVSITTCQC